MSLHILLEQFVPLHPQLLCGSERERRRQNETVVSLIQNLLMLENVEELRVRASR